MIPGLPKPQYKTRILARRQTTQDIAKGVLLAEKDSRIYTRILADFFTNKNSTALQDLNRAFDYVVKNIVYLAETDPQTVKTVPRILADKYGDCKHFATLMGSIARALGFTYFFRLTSYSERDPVPTHIYICIVIQGRILPVDPVYKQFGKEKGYFWKYDYKPLK